MKNRSNNPNTVLIEDEQENKGSGARHALTNDKKSEFDVDNDDSNTMPQIDMNDSAFYEPLSSSYLVRTEMKISG